jgi:putative membrane protein
MRREAEVREHLANERTLLSWVRTGVGLISLGFVVERAGALMRTASEQAGRSSSDIFGLALVLLGCLVLIIGSAQFFRYRRSITEGDFVPAAAPYIIVVAGALALAGAFIVYVLL